MPLRALLALQEAAPAGAAESTDGLTEFMNHPLTQEYLLPWVWGILTLLGGLVVIRILAKWLRHGLVKANVDPSLHTFLCTLLSWGLKVVLFITVADTVGLPLMGLTALLAGAGLAIGLALQGHLQNIAGGVLILFFRPFRVGDFIETQGYTGAVADIQVFVTLLKTPDNKTIILPNGPLSTSNITNFTIEDNRRVDIAVGISYGDDIRKAREIVLQTVEKDQRILAEPAPVAVVKDLGDNSVNLAVRVWAPKAEYWNVYFENIEAIKYAFDENDITIPFPQRDVHLFQEK